MVDVVKGRGAWTSVGKDSGRSYYEFHKGEPMDGSSPEKSFNHEAVTLGVKSIEQRLNDLGYDLVVDGTYGPRVKKAVADFQGKNGISKVGNVGWITGPALWHDHIESVGLAFKFPTSYVWGIMRQESGGDPGAVGYDTPGDRGLFQFNTLVHDITPAQAHDFQYATDTMFARFGNAWRKYQGKGPELREACSILQHKSPASADQWFETGESPGPVSSDYVSKVKAFSLTF
jgi:Putative peptidoglycan binding domain